jgi:hypothetical protein
VDRQAPRRVSTPGEAGSSKMEIQTRSSQRTADRLEGVFLALAMVGDATSPMTEGFRTRARTDNEESVTSFVSRSSLVLTVTKKKKRILISLTPDISQELAMKVRMKLGDGRQRRSHTAGRRNNAVYDDIVQPKMNLCEGAEGRVKLYIHRLAKPSFEKGGTNAKQRHCSDEARGRKDDRVGRRERSPSPRAIAKDCLRARMPTVWRLGLRVWPPSARGQERECASRCPGEEDRGDQILHNKGDRRTLQGVSIK